MMDNASALPTCPQRQQRQQPAIENWAKIHPLDHAMKLFNDYRAASLIRQEAVDGDKIIYRLTADGLARGLAK
jgi:hypothetical protein